MDILIIIPIILFLTSCLAIYVFFSVLFQWRKEKDKNWNKSYIQRLIGLGLGGILTMLASIWTLNMVLNPPEKDTTNNATVIEETEHKIVSKGE